MMTIQTSLLALLVDVLVDVLMTELVIELMAEPWPAVQLDAPPSCTIDDYCRSLGLLRF